jgi:GNAT superfamily N-acetyltransferase
VVAAAHLLRYASEERVSEGYRNLGEIRWLVFEPDNVRAGDALLGACISRFEDWGVVRQAAAGSLPCACCYGVPDSWPHLRALLVGGGFRNEGRTEVILVADVADLALDREPPIEGLTLRREMRVSTRLSARLGDELIGFVDFATDLTSGGTLSRLAGWGELDTLWVDESHRRRGIGAWLVGQAADWLRLGHADRFIAYSLPEQTAELAFLTRLGFRELVRTECYWVRGEPSPGDAV